MNAECIYKNSKSSIFVFYFLIGKSLPELTGLKVNGFSAKSSVELLSVWLAAKQPGKRVSLLVAAPDDAVMLSGLKIHVLIKASSVIQFYLACSHWQNGKFTAKTKFYWKLLTI